ncbi:unnamed protein product [Psylliodes chrysocephalus]|uniref:Uncharacterized protein n=1 Tax=Psylliodes chrysocephalus TaxID=3402493 RepID=A0A9P0GAM2_9CUCU|nr:unnamed protein product [Psylliodes chrysocephala]
MENIPQIVPINPETNEISLPYELENETHSLDQTLKTLINIETNDIEILSISKSQPLDEENLYPITINTMEVTIPFDEENLHTTSEELNSVDMVVHENDELESSDADDDQEYIPNQEEVGTDENKNETSDSRKRKTKNIIKHQNVHYGNEHSDENSDEKNQEQNFTLKKKKRKTKKRKGKN